MPNQLYTVKPIQVSPLEFKATTFTPKDVDFSILQNSLGKIEERRNNFSKANTALNTALGSIGEQMHNDPTTAKWFLDYSNKAKADIMSAAAMGDMDEARFRAEKWASDAANNPQVRNRIRANAEYDRNVKVQQERLARHEISQDTYDWWYNKNPYQYADDYDENGNLTGAYKEQDYNQPVNDINWSDLVEKAFSRISPNRRGFTRQDEKQWGSEYTTGYAKGQKVNQKDLAGKADDLNFATITTSSGSTSHSESNTREWVSPQSILNNVKQMIIEDPDLMRGVYQGVEVSRFKLQQKKTQLESMSESDPNYNLVKSEINQLQRMTTTNGSPDDEKGFDNYITAMTNEFALRRSYNNVTSSVSNGSSSTSGFTFSGGSGSRGSGNIGSVSGINPGQVITDGNGNIVTVKGPQVQGQLINPVGTAQSAAQGAAAAVNMAQYYVEKPDNTQVRNYYPKSSK